MDLYNELQNKIETLNIAINELKENGKKYASSYSKYRIELAKELTRLKNEGVAVTLAYDIARGKEEIANLKFEEIKCESYYKASQERVNVLKLQIRILDSQLQREYTNKYGV